MTDARSTPFWFVRTEGASDDELAQRLEASGLEVERASEEALDTELGRDAPALLLSPLAVRHLGERLADLEARVRAAGRLETLGRLVGGVAHDFNNLLSVVATLSELMLRFGKLPESDQEDLREIHAAAQRGSELTRQLLAFVRAEPNERGTVHVTERVRLADKLLRKLLPEDVALEVSVAEAPAAVYAGPAEIDHAIFNLVAWGRSRLGGGGQLAFSVEADKDTVRVTVACRPRTGAPRVEWGGGREARAALERVAEQLAGRVEEHDDGMRLTLHLPVPVADAAAAVEARVDEAQLRGRRVLVVEGARTGGRVLSRLVASLGVEVADAADGAEALERLGAPGASFDAVVAELVLEDLWGTGLVERAPAGLPIVFVTGHVDHPALAEARRRALPVLHKPLTRARLADALIEAVAGA